jgi:hypothetical protein
MKLLLNNGVVIGDAPLMSEKTRDYIKQYWKFPKKEDLERIRRKYYSRDCKRYWQEKVNIDESEITNNMTPI